MLRAATALLVTLTWTAPLWAQGGFYLDRLSAAAGETVQVHASTGTAFEVHVLHAPQLSGEVTLRSSGVLPINTYPAASGSWAGASDAPALGLTGTLTLEAWVRPSWISGSAWAGILTKYSYPGHTAYGIYLMPGGQVSFYLGETGVFSASNRLLTTNPLPLKQWTHVVATYDGQTKRIYLDGVLDVSEARTGAIFDTTEPVRIGSFGSSGAAGNFFTGAIDSPAIHSVALTPAEITTRTLERADYDANTPGVLATTVAQWNLEELDGVTLGDATGNGHDLTLVNQATRSVPGPAWSGAGQPGEWCVRFSAADRHNPAWPAAWSFSVPPSWTSGSYLVQIEPTSGASSYLPFFVKPAPGEQASIAVLAATNTWAAYNGWSKGFYSTHAGGEINYYSGLQQPNPGAYAKVQTPGSGYSHLVDAERYLWSWLDESGYAFDIYTDLDLHRDPTLLDGYRVLMLSGHSEYWSTEMIDHLVAFQDAGGSVVNLSGNTMWSRVTFDPSFTMLEGRKHPWSTRPNVIPPGERWHSQAGGVLGGTLRCVGYSEHAILGTGFGLTMIAKYGVYQVADPGHWVFAGTGVGAGTLFGQDSLNGDGIIGFETDVVDTFWGTPANLEVLASGVNFTGAASTLDITDCETRVWGSTTSGGEMVYFDHPGGGGVFGAPSVTFAGSLAVDPIAPRILRNVLQHFLQLSLKYCSAGTSASGCQASLSATGTASATASSGFQLAASTVEGQKDGLYFFGTSGRQANPWGNGSSLQCVVPPVTRAGLLAGSGTAGQCDGAFSQDLNALWTAKPAKNPGAGVLVQAQLWYRDALSTGNQTTSLSDALEFYVGP